MIGMEKGCKEAITDNENICGDKVTSLEGEMKALKKKHEGDMRRWEDELKEKMKELSDQYYKQMSSGKLSQDEAAAALQKKMEAQEGM